ncbi:hypothetical protein R3P38DRAFT_3425666 [Favolaschia claudopus]|uniref:Uncharacterized protein n=1 Tax=Favolaschia claudopus TaxID=2862362 RepID=A0AAV9ZWV0_9AGAR
MELLVAEHSDDGELEGPGDDWPQSSASWALSRPPALGDAPPEFRNSSELITHWLHTISSSSTSDCKLQADAGNPDKIYEFALRVGAGVGVAANQALSRIYWGKLLGCEQSSEKQIAFAHAQLIMFTGVATEDGNAGPALKRDDRLHSILEAGEHAELAAKAGFGDAPNLLKLARVLHDETISTHVNL